MNRAHTNSKESNHLIEGDALLPNFQNHLKRRTFLNDSYGAVKLLHGEKRRNIKLSVSKNWGPVVGTNGNSSRFSM